MSRGLLAFNEARLGPAREVKVSLFARASDGRVVGGLLGHHRWTWLYVHRLWVEAPWRGRGIGGQLLARAEALGIAAGCRHAALETFSFQAPSFYERRGYVVYGTLTDFPPGHAQLFLRKPLAPGNPAGQAPPHLDDPGA